MHRPDFEPFREILNRLASTFSKPVPDDLTVQAYWGALRDLPIEMVRRCAEVHTRYGKFFPKPVELRPKDEKPEVVKGGDDLAALNRQSERAWEEIIHREGTAGRLKLAHARMARYDVEQDQSSLALAEKKAWLTQRIEELQEDLRRERGAA